MAVFQDACCSVLEPLQFKDISGIATAPKRAAALEVRLDDANIKSFYKCLREEMLDQL